MDDALAGLAGLGTVEDANGAEVRLRLHRPVTVYNVLDGHEGGERR